MDGAWQDQPTFENIREFLKMLGLCHTVLPEGGEEQDTCKYQVTKNNTYLFGFGCCHQILAL